MFDVVGVIRHGDATFCLEHDVICTHITKEIVTQMQGTTTRCCPPPPSTLNDLILPLFIPHPSISCPLASFCLQGATLAAKSTTGWQNIVSVERMPTLFWCTQLKEIYRAFNVCLDRKEAFLAVPVSFAHVKQMLES